MEMTIKQLADQLGTNKMVIHRAIRKLGLQGQLNRVDNRYMISDSQAAQIRSIVLSTPNVIERNVSNKTERNVTNQAEQNVSETHKTQTKAIKSKNKSYQIKQNKTYQQKSNETYHNDLQLSILNEQLVVKDNQIQMLQQQLVSKDIQIAEKDEQIKLLQQQLIAKDNQIGQITAAMESMATALTAAQALHAGTIQKQLTEHSTMDQSSDEMEQPKQKQSFLSKWFHKKE